jgi:HK97 family phage major capsid protein
VALSPQTFTGAGWIPIGTDPAVIEQVKMNSFVETFGTPVGMTTRTKWTPRTSGVKMGRVAPGAGGYTHDTTSINDSVLLTYDKFGGLVDLEDEDLQDTSSNMVEALSNGAGASYARLFDNVCIGITAAKGTSGWNFDSLYYLLTQDDTATGYTGNSNITKTATAGGATYTDFNKALKQYERSAKWANIGNTVVGAHPLVKSEIRGVVDTQGRPIFIESSGGDSGGAQGTGDTIFGYPVRWSYGLATSAAGSDEPNGHPLMVIGNRGLLKRGDREELQAHFADPDTSGYGFDGDVGGLKFRAKKAFVPGALPGFSILEFVS